MAHNIHAMIQDAINELCSLMDGFPEVFKINITDRNDIELMWNCKKEKMEKSKEFKSAQEMVEFMESNLHKL